MSKKSHFIDVFSNNTCKQIDVYVIISKYKYEIKILYRLRYIILG